jgi:hypothetical protein
MDDTSATAKPVTAEPQRRTSASRPATLDRFTPVPQRLAPTGADIASDIEHFIRRFVSFPSDEEPAVLALWVMHTHCIKASTVTPYLYITSAEKRSGKTRLLELLELLADRTERMVSPTGAIFRLIESLSPTLLIDEVDTVFVGNGDAKDALRGVLNSGYHVGGVVHRYDAKIGMVPYSTFCPKAFAGIDNGQLPDTLLDRSIQIRLPAVCLTSRSSGSSSRTLALSHSRCVRGSASGRWSTSPTSTPAVRSRSTSTTTARPRLRRRCWRSPT